MFGKSDPENPAPGPMPDDQKPTKVQLVCPSMEVRGNVKYQWDLFTIFRCQCGETVGPAVLSCSGCSSTVWSTVSSSTSTLGWVWFSLCYCCCLGCGLLPFCVQDFKIFTHICPTCGNVLKIEKPQITKAKICIIVTLLVFQTLFWIFLVWLVLKYYALI